MKTLAKGTFIFAALALVIGSAAAADQPGTELMQAVCGRPQGNDISGALTTRMA